MMHKQTQYRQGDVLIQQVDAVPTDAQKQPARRRIVLAEGEATGHCHSLEVAEDSEPANHWRMADEQFVELPAPAKVTHQEHGAVKLPGGTYRVRRQREYSPTEIRNVAD